MAISSQSGKLLNTACFDQALNQVWYGKLSITNHRTMEKLVQLVTFVSLGFLAPFLIAYRAYEPVRAFFSPKIITSYINIGIGSQR